MTDNKIQRAIYDNANQMYVFIEMLAKNTRIDKSIRKDALNMINVIKDAAGESGYYPGVIRS